MPGVMLIHRNYAVRSMVTGTTKPSHDVGLGHQDLGLSLGSEIHYFNAIEPRSVQFSYIE